VCHVPIAEWRKLDITRSDGDVCIGRRFTVFAPETPEKVSTLSLSACREVWEETKHISSALRAECRLVVNDDEEEDEEDEETE